MRKEAEVTTEVLLRRNRDLRTQYSTPLIKWFEATMSRADRYKMGLMSMDEFNEWQEDLAAGKEDEIDAFIIGDGAGESAPKDMASEAEEKTNHTFWEDDDGDRENLDQDSYEAFLAQNGLNVSNMNALDIDSLMQDDKIVLDPEDSGDTTEDEDSIDSDDTVTDISEEDSATESSEEQNIGENIDDTTSSDSANAPVEEDIASE